MVRALAGDSTMTRFFGTAGSVAPGPLSRPFRPRGCGAGSPRRSRGPPRPRRRLGLGVGACAAGSVLVGRDRHRRVATRDRAGRDLDEPDVQVREEEDRRRCRRRTPAACRSSGAGSCSAARRRPARAPRTGRPAAAARRSRCRITFRIIGSMVAATAAARQPADGPVRGGRSRSPGGRARPRPRRRSRPGRTSRSSGSRSARRWYDFSALEEEVRAQHGGVRVARTGSRGSPPSDS